MTIFRKKNMPRYLSAGFMLLMALAVFVKAMIPAGFMPDAQSGMIRMVICSGMGEKTVFVPADDTGGHQQPGQSTDHCPYQTFSAGKFIPAPSVFVVHTISTVTVESRLPTHPLLSNILTYSVGLRGPPLFV